jgi:hypothetical protein
MILFLSEPHYRPNNKLETVNYLVSYGLLVPLRQLDGFVDALREDYTTILANTDSIAELLHQVPCRPLYGPHAPPIARRL